MKSRNLFFLVVIFLFLVGKNLPAQKYDSIPSTDSGFLIGAFVGFPSYSSMGRNMEAVELSTGSGPIVWTGRFYRAKGVNGYFFENALEVGWRKRFCHYFTNTLSAGYSNLAFEKSVISGPEISPWNFDKVDGFILEEKLVYGFHRKNQGLSPWGIAVNYYYIFNPKKPVQGLSLGIDLNLENMYWQNSNRRYRREKRELKAKEKKELDAKLLVIDSTKKSKIVIPYHYRIRTNFITGLIFSPHLDFEYRYNKNWGLGIGIFARPELDWRPRYVFLTNPDFQLTGYGGFVDWINYKPGWNRSYWAFGLRCGYRNLSGSCAMGGNYITPDYYVQRRRQDIVTAWRVSFVMPPENSHWSIDWYFTFGARTSFYKTRFPVFAIWDPSASFDYPKTGCYLLPEFNAGFEIGFGW